MLSASPQGRYLHLKLGFRVVEEVKMRIEDYLNHEEWLRWCEERRGLGEEEREKESVMCKDSFFGILGRVCHHEKI